MKPAAGTALVFDFGARRIGVAFANRAVGTTSPVCMLPARNGVPDWRQVDALVVQWQPALFLVGWPLNMDGSEGTQCAPAAAFATTLGQRFGREVLLIDERLSSIEARARVHAAAVRRGGNRHVAISDPRYQAASAEIIAESWLQAPATARSLAATDAEGAGTPRPDIGQ